MFSTQESATTISESDATPPSTAPRWRQHLARFAARLPNKFRRALTSRKTLALFLIALLGKLAFYGVLAWQVLIRS
ncbi:MAG TPA: hypothetical protein VFQ05_11340 [Candidatus Eisenbacteria bacterium]|nr:hypothetical protein [Candidatus Eisenbacteria bacterium]